MFAIHRFGSEEQRQRWLPDMAKAPNADTFAEGEPALAAYGDFNRIAAKPKYLPEGKAAMLAALETLRVLIRTGAGLRLDPRPLDDAWALIAARPPSGVPGCSPSP